MLISLVALITCIIPWYFVSPYLATPIIALAGQLMEFLFGWVQGYERHETVGTLLTSLKVMVDQDGRRVVGELSPEVNYRTFGYGLVLFWALLMASRPVAFWSKMALGTLIIVPSQVLSMCFRWLREALLSNYSDVYHQAGVPRWMLDVIAYFDQLGFLIITPMMPVIIWLLLDQAFVRRLWVEMLYSGAIEAKLKHKAGSKGQ